ncbi:S1 RNA-binding domain-containing protein [Nocardiopsis protaetiae]|uniref:S1 RNA-binding domain-containing protein n=1 Tax=Nocardiopsis protaetiae TaxID=3382270 RepID=UPI00387B340A
MAVDGLPGGVHVGDVLAGTVVEVPRPRTWVVKLDHFPEGPLGEIGPLDLTWDFSRERPKAEPGRRVTAAVAAQSLHRGRIRLSAAAAEHPGLWAFLSTLSPGALLSGTVAEIRNFGVFVALDDGPPHPAFPGVGFITIPELSWSWFKDPAEVVRVGQRVTCRFVHFDTSNGEARLSLRDTLPDPFQTFADRTTAGDRLRGEVVKEIPFGVLVRVAEAVEGLLPSPEGAGRPAVGEVVTVTVAEIDRAARKLLLAFGAG